MLLQVERIGEVGAEDADLEARDLEKVHAPRPDMVLK